MKKIIMITLVSLIVNTNIIYAECTTKDTEYFKSIEDKYQVSYEFNKDTRTYTLILTYEDASSFTYGLDGLEIKDTDIKFSDNKLLIVNLNPGQYTIYVVGASDSCNDIFKTEEITLPQYNQYAYDPACEGIEEFALCSPTYDKYLDYNTFISRVNSYKKNKTNNTTPDNNVKEENTVLEWLKDNYMYFIYATIGIVVLLIIILIIKTIYNNERKRRRLE